MTKNLKPGVYFHRELLEMVVIHLCRSQIDIIYEKYSDILVVESKAGEMFLFHEEELSEFEYLGEL